MPYINVDEAYILDNTGLQVDNSVDYANANANRNLLDNPWFTINQRSASTIPVGGYGVDRWKGGSAGAANVVSGGLQFSGAANAYQVPDSTFFSSLVGKTATASLLFSDGTVQSGTKTITNSVVEFGTFNGVRLYISSSHNFNMETSAGASATIRAVKLEVGSYSTLVNDVAPNYNEELAKCRCYYERIVADKHTTLGLGYPDGNNTLYIYFKINPKRGAISNTTFSQVSVGQGSMSTSASAVSTWHNTTNGEIILAVTATGAFTPGQIYRAGVLQGGYIDFSADL